MFEKRLKIRDICGYYALGIPNYNGSNFTTELLLFNSKKNAENVKRIIEIDRNKSDEAAVCDTEEIKYGKWIATGNTLGDVEYHCSECDNYVFLLYNYCPYCDIKWIERVIKMAEWIKDYEEDYYCSECGHYLEPYELLPHLIIPNECSDCGAKMDGKEEK